MHHNRFLIALESRRTVYPQSKLRCGSIQWFHDVRAAITQICREEVGYCHSFFSCTWHISRCKARPSDVIGVKWVVIQKITLRLFPSICCSRNDRLKNKAQDVVDGMTALISGDNQLKNVLHRAWTCFGLSSTAKRQITKVISRVAGGWNPDALVDSLLVRQLTRWKKGISSSDDSGVMNAP